MKLNIKKTYLSGLTILLLSGCSISNKNINDENNNFKENDKLLLEKKSETYHTLKKEFVLYLNDISNNETIEFLNQKISIPPSYLNISEIKPYKFYLNGESFDKFPNILIENQHKESTIINLSNEIEYTFLFKNKFFLSNYDYTYKNCLLSYEKTFKENCFSNTNSSTNCFTPTKIEIIDDKKISHINNINSLKSKQCDVSLDYPFKRDYKKMIKLSLKELYTPDHLTSEEGIFDLDRIRFFGVEFNDNKVFDITLYTLLNRNDKELNEGLLLEINNLYPLVLKRLENHLKKEEFIIYKNSILNNKVIVNTKNNKLDNKIKNEKKSQFIKKKNRSKNTKVKETNIGKKLKEIEERNKKIDEKYKANLYKLEKEIKEKEKELESIKKSNKKESEKMKEKIENLEFDAAFKYNTLKEEIKRLEEEKISNLNKKSE